jgi:hypothetical protein
MRRIAMTLLAGLCAAPAARAEPYVNYASADRRSSRSSSKSPELVIIGTLRLKNRHSASGLCYASSAGEFAPRARLRRSEWSGGRRRPDGGSSANALASPWISAEVEHRMRLRFGGAPWRGSQEKKGAEA